jgi:hypothetical protein
MAGFAAEVFVNMTRNPTDADDMSAEELSARDVDDGTLQNKRGKDICFLCDAREGLRGIPRSRVQDAQWVLQTQGVKFPVGRQGQARGLPTSRNKLCANCYPELQANRIIGSVVAVRKSDNNYWHGIVAEPAQPLASATITL